MESGGAIGFAADIARSCWVERGAVDEGAVIRFSVERDSICCAEKEEAVDEPKIRECELEFWALT